jgi:uncharacterized membrane protein
LTGEEKTLKKISMKAASVIPPIAPDRLVYLSDGIYAIAMTLTAVQIQIPTVEPDSLFGPELLQIQANLLAYALSFYVLARLWVGHLSRFRLVKQIDLSFIWLSLISLGLVALIPPATNFSNAFPSHPIAVVSYLLLVFSLTTVDWIAYSYALKRGPAVESSSSSLSNWRHKDRLLIPSISLACAVLAVRFPEVALPAFGVLIILSEAAVIFLHRSKPRQATTDDSHP